MAVQSRDHRFDGWFVTAVRTTGIYCRPSCPAITPKRANVDFFPTAAAAQQRGFRACKRCRPDASPGSPEWNVRQDVVGRAMRLIADGCVEREGVPGLARRLGYSERHLNRLMTEELGAGPLAIARAQRAHTARLLIETTDLALTDVAFAAGFGSVRQFNDTIREVFATSPTDLRAAHRGRRSARRRRWRGGPTGAVSLRLPTRQPFAGDDVLAFLGQRALPGVESWDGTVYRRSLRLPGGHGVVSLRAATDHVAATVRLSSWTDLGAAVQRIRRLLDLDADPEAVDAALSGESLMATLVGGAARPSGARQRRLRSRRACAPSSANRSRWPAPAPSRRSWSHAVGERLSLDDPDLTHVFPRRRTGRRGPGQWLRHADLTARHAAPVGRARSPTAPSCSTPASIPNSPATSLLGLKGIGPWTADYVVMRGLSHPDVFLGSDLGVIHALDRLTASPPDPTCWAPWRSYAVHHLWADLSAPPPHRRHHHRRHARPAKETAP